MDDGSEGIRSRALAHARVRQMREPRSLRMAAVSAAILLHLLAAVCLYLLMQSRPMLDEGRIEVRLLDAAPREPDLPEPPLQLGTAPRASLPSAPAVTRQSPMTSPLSVPATTAPTNSATFDSATLFNVDGSVRLGPVAKPTPHEAGMERGRELMARGHNMLHCSRTAVDPVPRLTALERGADSARRARLMAWARQPPGAIPAEMNAHMDNAYSVAFDRIVDRIELAGQDCDDTFYRRPPPKPPRSRVQP